MTLGTATIALSPNGTSPHFASLGHTASVHRPAEQVFAVEEEDNQEEEMFAVVDRQQWNTRRAAEPPLSPEEQQMFALARRMGYEM